MCQSYGSVIVTFSAIAVVSVQMHDNKYLHLPVVEESSGKVLGVVAVMEIILAIAGEEGSTGYDAILSPP